MSMTKELIRMATISNIMLLREKLGKARLSFDELNAFSDDALRHGRDTLIKQYNSTVATFRKEPKVRGLKPDGCIIDEAGNIKSDCIVKEDDE